MPEAGIQLMANWRRVAGRQRLPLPSAKCAATSLRRWHGTATMDDNAAALAAAETTSAILTHADKKVRTVARSACGTMGQYVTTTAAMAVLRHADNQAAASAHLASTVMGLVNGSQWDWTSNNDDDKVRM
jgi:hypothetical protein